MGKITEVHLHLNLIHIQIFPKSFQNFLLLLNIWIWKQMFRLFRKFSVSDSVGFAGVDLLKTAKRKCETVLNQKAFFVFCYWLLLAKRSETWLAVLGKSAHFWTFCTVSTRNLWAPHVFLPGCVWSDLKCKICHQIRCWNLRSAHHVRFLFTYCIQRKRFTRLCLAGTIPVTSLDKNTFLPYFFLD